MSIELRIPVFHGELAAKQWGNPDARVKCLSLHGWQDNANSFDPLMAEFKKELEKDLCVIALDFSGHGLSSHLPPGSLYTHHVYIMDILYTLNQLKWSEDVNLLCHSFGGGLALFFAVMFPERVSKIVTVDATFPFWYPMTAFSYFLERSYAHHGNLRESLVSNSLRSAPEYTKEEYLESIARFSSVFYPRSPEGSTSKENTLLLLERGSRSISNEKFVLTRDNNIKNFFPESGGPSRLHELLPRFEKRLKMMMFQPDKGAISVFKETYDVLREEGPKHMKSFEYVVVEDATHHVHMNEPNKLVDKIKGFLL